MGKRSGYQPSASNACHPNVERRSAAFLLAKQTSRVQSLRKPQLLDAPAVEGFGVAAGLGAVLLVGHGEIVRAREVLARTPI